MKISLEAVGVSTGVHVCGRDHDHQCCTYQHTSIPEEHQTSVKCMYGHEYDLDDGFRSAITDVRDIITRKFYLNLPVVASEQKNNYYYKSHHQLICCYTFQMDWVCDDAWIGPFTQLMHYVGAAIGAIIFGYLSDVYGRYPIFVATNLLVLATGFTLPFCTDMYSFSLNRFLMGSTHAIYFSALYLLGKQEYIYDRELWVIYLKE